MAAMAAAAAAASDALFPSFTVPDEAGLSSFVEAGWSHLLLEDIDDGDGGLRVRRVYIKGSPHWAMYLTTFSLFSPAVQTNETSGGSDQHISIILLGRTRTTPQKP